MGAPEHAEFACKLNPSWAFRVEGGTERRKERVHNGFEAGERKVYEREG